MTNVKGVIITLLMSQTAWIVLFLVGKFSFIAENAQYLLPIGIVALSFVIIILRKLLPRDELITGRLSDNEQRGIVYYMCCLFAWASVVDGIFYLEANDKIQGFLASFYFKVGEPYLGTSFGTVANLWDSVIHYFLYLRIIYSIDNGLEYRNTLLFYLGSMLTSMVCLLFGGISGTPYGGMKPCTFLNIPFYVIPMYVLLQVTNQKRKYVKLPRGAYKIQGGYIYARHVLAVATVAVGAYTWLRGFTALSSPTPAASYYGQNIEPYILEPSKFGTVWALSMMFIGTIFYAYTLYGLYHQGCEWMLDWSIFFAGVSIYGFIIQLAQFCPGVSSEYHPSDDSVNTVLFGNAMVALVPTLVAYFCFSNIDFFRQPASLTYRMDSKRLSSKTN